MPSKALLRHSLPKEAFPKSPVWVICTTLTSILGIDYISYFFVFVFVSPHKPRELGEQACLLFVCLTSKVVTAQTLPHTQLSNQKSFIPPFHHSPYPGKHHVFFFKLNFTL